MTDNTGPRLAGEGLCRNACRLKREVVRAVMEPEGSLPLAKECATVPDPG